MQVEEKMMPAKVWWKDLHWPEYGAELVGTAVLLFGGLSAVVFDLGADSPLAHVLPDVSMRRLITGLLFAGSGALVAISPLGRLSGAHINPSVSLAFWLQGKMHRLDLAGYILGQFLGAIIGTALVIALWGGRAASVGFGRTEPGGGYPIWLVFLAEISLTFLLVFSIFIFVSSPRLMRWTPLMVWLEAPISGTSLNTARSFGPALLTWFWQYNWLYWLAPPLGSVLAVGAFRLLSAGERDVLTGKLFHVPHYRSVFKNVSAPSMPASGKLKKSK